MKYKYLCPCLLLMGMWLALPVFVSANSLPYCGESWNTGNPLIHKVQQGFKDYWTGLSYSGSGGTDSGKHPFGNGPSDVRDMKSREDLTPSPNLSPSVDGHTGVLDRHFDVGRRPESGDPAVKGLSGMDGGGFAPPGSYTGSGRRP